MSEGRGNFQEWTADQVLKALWNSVVNVQVRMDFWHCLFADKARVERLNEIAGGPIGLVQRSMWDEILISLARLYDPARTHKNLNLSLYALVEDYELPRAADARKRVEKLLDDAPTDELNDVRRKLIAHNDRQWNLEGVNQSGFTYGMEKRLLKTAQDVLNEVNLDLNDSGYIWEWNDSAFGADRLFKLLDAGKRREEELGWLEKQYMADADAGCPVAMSEFMKLGGFKMKAQTY
ncbi:MAG: hypothetical protein AAFR96_13190 [Planctomycetota bacterium]